MKRMALFVLLSGSAALSLCARVPPHARPAFTPPCDSAFTCTREVTCIAVAGDGTVWAGTTGGVLRRTTDGTWTKYDRRSGLPSHEVRSIRVESGRVTVAFPRAEATWTGAGWHIESGVHTPALRGDPERTLCSTTWQGRKCAATVAGLHIEENGKGRLVPLPSSTGTHISAVLSRGGEIWAALFGDGLWAYDGYAWKRVEVGLPDKARDITTLAADGDTLWVGTRRAGIWQYYGSTWRQHLTPDEPYQHNGEALAVYHGDLYVSTLEDGLVVRTPDEWRCLGRGDLSSDAPREMVEFQDSLYVRHGNGMVDRFDGERWQRNVFADLPRKQVSALASDGQKLYAAQWGGWSEYDGRTWTHHLRLPELQGRPITALWPDGGTLWVGTQNHGVAEVRGDELRWNDERRGMPDDWITCLRREGGQLFAGTFVGGLARWDGARWNTSPELDGQNVTSLASDGSGGLYVGTRAGLWYRSADGRMLPVNQRAPFLDTELQGLCKVQSGLWVATRTGLFFLRDRT